MMKFKSFLLILLCCAMLLSTAGCQQQPTPTEPPHQHTFEDWKLQQAALCSQEGRETRYCTGCGFVESRAIPKEAHVLGNYNICKACKYVDFDDNANFVELGVVCDYLYGKTDLPKSAWDIKIWNGKVYRGAGDYDKNSGSTPFYSYNIATKSWEQLSFASDEAIHRFIEINGTLYSPGIDPTESWSEGNYYVLEGNVFQQVRNLPNGIHCFDMIEFDGKIFAGVGTETTANTVAVSEKGGSGWKFVPLYQDGKPMELSGYEWSRTYEFVEYNGDLYALISLRMGIGSLFAVFRYEDGKMVYLRNASGLLGGISTGRTYWEGKFAHNGVCYLSTGYLYAITDFSDEKAAVKINMPQKEQVSDAILKDGVIYTLAFRALVDKSSNKRIGYTTTIYQSTTGEAGSFTEVLSFDYACMPISFDYDGEHFYIGMGVAQSDQTEKSGMVLRVKP